MKAVFLDSETFLAEVDLHTPAGITDYKAYADTEQNDDLIVERCQDADVIIANKIDFGKSLLQRLPKLKLIQLTSTGIDHADKNACDELGVELFNVAGYAVKSVPEHTFMLMLSAMRACNYYHNAVVGDAWQKDGKFCFIDQPLFDLEDKTLGIIGVGNIGKRVADIAKAFGMKVLIAERQGHEPRSAEYTAFEEVLATADVLSLHCPLTAETKYLVNAETIALMKKKPLIVNVARGGVVNSQDMANALDNGDVFGYASDVFEVEPVKNTDPLRKFINHPRVVYSPHNAWGSIGAQQELWERACQQIGQFVKKHQS